MRFNLRLHGRTPAGQRCQADVLVYAASQRDLQEQANQAAEQAAWLAKESPQNPIPEDTEITIERVERL